MNVYVDVLFVINFFITYLLLLLTRALTKCTSNQWRILAGAFLGGAYSLIILAPSLNALSTIVGRLIVSVIIVFASFGFRRLAVFVKSVLCFYFSNLVFVGIILAIWLTLRPKGIIINNDTVYFDIPALTLLVLALAAYVISIGIIKIYNYTISKREIYSLTVIREEHQWHLFAFADSGNRLTEPFSDYPVIIASREKIDFPCERIIPYNTVGGEGMLNAFKPDRVVISNGKATFECDRVYVALGNVDSKEFSAILNPQILNI